MNAMKKLLLLMVLMPMFCMAQKIPDSGFDKVRIADGTTTIQAELLPVNSDPSVKSDRFYYWYGGSLIHSTQGGFSGTLLNGTYNEYYLNKSLKEQGTFNKGLKDGVWKSWNSDGYLVQLYTWDNGLKSGKFMECDAKGIIVKSGTYKHNVFVVPDSSSFLHRIDIFKKKDQ